LLTGFCVLSALAWAASLIVLCVEEISNAQRLHALAPVWVGLLFATVEVVLGLLVGRRVRKSPDILASKWTVVAVVVALCLVPANVSAGAIVG
jgi:hypothetical protein